MLYLFFPSDSFSPQDLWQMFADLVHTGKVCREIRFMPRYEIMPLPSWWGGGGRESRTLTIPLFRGKKTPWKGNLLPAQGRMERSGMAPWVKKSDKTSRPAGAKEPPTRSRDDTYPLTGSPAFAPVGRRIVCASR